MGLTIFLPTQRPWLGKLVREREFLQTLIFLSLKETCRKLLLSINNKDTNRCLAEVASCQHGEIGGILLIPGLLSDSPQGLQSS